VHKSSQSSY